MYGIKLRVWGEYACFTRPEMKVERVSYDVITPSAARGIIEAIYWKPQIRWVIDRITVMNPIVFINVRRNEVSEKVSAQKAIRQSKGGDAEVFIVASENRHQRAAKLLRDVEYIIEAHFELTSESTPELEKKHYNIALRRMKEGQCYKQPCLGTREFACHFQLMEGETPESRNEGEVDLGYMLYDLEFKFPEITKENIVYSNDAAPVFYRPKMMNGVIEVAKYYSQEVMK